jgi:putative Mg2+ transporter-C (MgtC) family protein
MDPVQAIGLGESLFRLSLATAIGAVIGVDRDLRGKPAGVRTLSMVTLGSALLALIGAAMTVSDGRPDPSVLSRVIQGIMAGIGFLGGGCILRDEAKLHVQGLTTASAVWVSASLGVACGAGYWRIALLALGIALVVLIGGEPLERGVERLTASAGRRLQPAKEADSPNSRTGGRSDARSP